MPYFEIFAAVPVQRKRTLFYGCATVRRLFSIKIENRHEKTI